MQRLEKIEIQRGTRKRNETPWDTWLGGARKGICYAEPLAGKRKSGILGTRRRPKATLWERNSWES